MIVKVSFMALIVISRGTLVARSRMSHVHFSAQSRLLPWPMGEQLMCPWAERDGLQGQVVYRVLGLLWSELLTILGHELVVDRVGRH